MHLSAYLTIALSVVTSEALSQGFNADVRKPDGSCKTQADWEADFKKIISLPGDFNSIRLFNSLECDSVNVIAPAAIATGGKVLATVAIQLPGIFAAEKQQLLRAVTDNGFEWLAAVSVGYNDLKDNHFLSNSLAQKIYDVRGMLSTVPKYTPNVMVGHIDSWTAWIDERMAPVMVASNFIGTNSNISNQNNDIIPIQDNVKAYNIILKQVRESVAATGSKASIWIMEGGWPSISNPAYEVIPTIDVAQSQWKNIACPLFVSNNVFWKSLQHEKQSPTLGVLGADGKPLYDLIC